MLVVNPFLLLLSVAALVIPLASQVTAQTFRILHTFTDRVPQPVLVLAGNTLYGTTSTVASSADNNGTVFAVNTDGSGFSTLYTFSALDASVFPQVNSDGAQPVDAGPVLSGSTLYGATARGGTLGYGTTFAVNMDGTGFAPLYSFSFSDTEGWAVSALNFLGGALYGAIKGGGSSSNGIIFKINLDGSGLADVYDFTATVGHTNGLPMNGDGVRPNLLISSGGVLYGAADVGGRGGSGTVFSLNTDGTGFTSLHNFAPFGTNSTGSTGLYTNSDGIAPRGGLVLSSNTLYGTTYAGGSWGAGTLFGVGTDGTNFRTLHTFGGGDGWDPSGAMVLSGNTLYGTTEVGGSSFSGSVFAINTDGTGFRNLYTFSGGGDGLGPSGLVLSGNTLYGVANGKYRGPWTVFSVQLPVTAPQLMITPGLGTIVLTWPSNATGFTLQSSTSLGSSAVWTTVYPTPIIVNGQNTVTNPISGAQQFFRLSQ
jgi:uncharacterized repeat protein (TIGR03803 family)